MSEEKAKRVRRSKDEVVADKIANLEMKITNWKSQIAKAEKEIEILKTQPAARLKTKDVTDKMKELGLSLEDVMKMLESNASK